MPQYEGREKRFNQDLPGIVGNFMTAVSMADGKARMQDLAIVQEIAKMPNVELSQKIELLTQTKPVVYKSSIPALAAVESRPFLAETVDLEMSMNVSASTTDEKSVDSKTDVATQFSFRAGLFRASGSMKASVSTHSSKKRQSDYSATTDMKLHMIRHPLAEGLAKAIDTQNLILQKAAEADMAVITANLENSINDPEKVPALPDYKGENDPPAEVKEKPST